MDLVIKSLTSKYKDFSARATRKEFWFFVLFWILAYVILISIDIAVGTMYWATGYGIFSGIFALAVLIPYFAVGIRRLHDTNRSGWWLLVGCIPIIGTIWLIVLLCLKSDEGENRFG